jgi:hypothetical protein
LASLLVAVFAAAAGLNGSTLLEKRDNDDTLNGLMTKLPAIW